MEAVAALNNASRAVENEVTEGTLLGGKIRYRQFAGGHRSGFEPVLLAAAVPALPGQTVLEAGTGAGAALLCLGKRVAELTGTGIEIDPALTALANENFKINGFFKFSAVIGDAAHPHFGIKFDHVLANPPWHDAAGTISPDEKRALAHHAGKDVLASWLKGLALCLKPRGGMTLILPAAAFAEAAFCLKTAGFGSITLLPLWPRQGQAAKLVILGAKLGRQGPDRILPGLILHDDKGITPEAEAVLRGGAELSLLNTK